MLRTCSIANYLLEKLRKFCRYLFTKSNGNFTSCLWSSISELMCNIKEITYNTDVVLVDEMQLPKKAPKGCLSNLRIIFRTNFYDKCVCWYSSENLTDYEMWLLPLWCYAVGPIHSKRPCKYYDNPCEYHEVNNPICCYSTICQWLRWQIASKLLLRSSPLTSYHFGIHCTTTPLCFCFTLYIPLLQIRIIPAPVHSTLAPATKDESSKEWWMIPINQLSSLFSERGFCEQMFPT